MSCDKCNDGFFNFSSKNPLGCTKCDCNTQATKNVPNTNLTLCDSVTGQCKCKTNFVYGKRCDKCMDSMYNLGNI